MKVLVDTNILIPLEDTGKELSPEMAEIRRRSQQLGHVLCIHPSQKEDISRDSDTRRKEILFSRIRQYCEIPQPPTLTKTEREKYGWNQNNDNDRIDNLLLLSVVRGAVHFLVTEDRKIHVKARRVGIQENVHYSNQFVAYLRIQAEEEEDVYPPSGIEEILLHEIQVNQIFFDSLRSDYKEYDTWYFKKAREGRKAWCIRNDETVYAICIYKEEHEPEINDSGLTLDGKVLKLCTFKVGEEVRGRKLGERLLYSAFKYATEQGISYIYLHIFGEQHEILVSLCEDYGFQVVGKYRDRDDAYLKEMVPPSCSSDCVDDPLNYAVKYYPNYLDSPAVRKFIVPIRPKYHENLFPDSSSLASGLFSEDYSQYTAESNTIKKAYICHSNTQKIRSGDLLLFYRTEDRKSIECIGIVEQTYRGTDITKVLPMVSKRTVYSEEKIEKWLEKETLIILFRFLQNFNPVDYKVLSQAGIRGSIQTIRKISHEEYQRCFKQI